MRCQCEILYFSAEKIRVSLVQNGGLFCVPRNKKWVLRKKEKKSGVITTSLTLVKIKPQGINLKHGVHAYLE